MKRSLALLLLAATPVMAQEPQTVPATPEIAAPIVEEGKPQPGEILLHVKADGTVTEDKRVLTREQLTERLSAAAKLSKNQPVRLRGDANCTYQMIVEIIDLCQKAQIWNISFGTQRLQPPSK